MNSDFEVSLIRCSDTRHCHIFEIQSIIFLFFKKWVQRKSLFQDFTETGRANKMAGTMFRHQSCCCCSKHATMSLTPGTPFPAPRTVSGERRRHLVFDPLRRKKFYVKSTEASASDSSSPQGDETTCVLWRPANLCFPDFALFLKSQFIDIV